MNRNLYISKIYKFDEKKKAILLNPILEKARKINDNANYNDIELILLIYLNLKLYYNKEEMINNYLFRRNNNMVNLFNFKQDV